MGKTRCQPPQSLGQRKHPHARGEDGCRILKANFKVETPPRTWGRLKGAERRGPNTRNTPTHVGKTLCDLCPSSSRRKHPHARGEDIEDPRYSDPDIETPPRTWGRRAFPPWPRPSSGNTPTHVGKTARRNSVKSTKRKHPHARGEDARSAMSCLIALETPPRTWGRRGGPEPSREKRETPPRTWGRRSRHTWGTEARGNTPTHVGKTGTTLRNQKRRRKHPHARGEDRHHSSKSEEEAETPPRTWGRPVQQLPRGNEGGNTPTHVGKTRRPRFPP